MFVLRYHVGRIYKRERKVGMEESRRVVLGMSGGVDSAASALVLLRAGYEVVGLTALFLDNEISRSAAHDASVVCEQLGIAHITRDCTKLFQHEVISPFVKDYAQGLTPSPCLRCNAFAKIPILLEAADELGCEKIATGHYARIAQLASSNRFIVKTALDYDKDQSYMLSQLNQNQLSRLILPLGATTKAEVRIIAENAGLMVARKADSQDICFIAGDYYDYLVGWGLCEKPGNIIDRTGAILGRHKGLAAYTLGQRKGIGIAGPEPYYVIDKIKATNELVVGFKKDTLIHELVVDFMNWQAFKSLTGRLECMVKLRYRSQAVACIVEPLETKQSAQTLSHPKVDVSSSSVSVRLRSPQSITAPGQFAVFYQGEDVLGGGVISATMNE